MLSYYAKALVSLLISVAIIAVQWASGAYDGGVNGYEWLGLAALLFGPAGLVAAFANTPFSPATKALVQQVCSVVIVVVQGAQQVYSGGISTVEWLGIAAVLLSSLAVYAVPNSGTAPQRTFLVRNQAGAAAPLLPGAVVLIVLGLVLLLAFAGVLDVIGWILLILGVVALVFGIYSSRRTGTRL